MQGKLPLHGALSHRATADAASVGEVSRVCVTGGLWCFMRHSPCCSARYVVTEQNKTAKARHLPIVFTVRPLQASLNQLQNGATPGLLPPAPAARAS
jgi:hypothetical protein